MYSYIIFHKLSKDLASWKVCKFAATRSVASKLQLLMQHKKYTLTKGGKLHVLERWIGSVAYTVERVLIQ